MNKSVSTSNTKAPDHYSALRAIAAFLVLAYGISSSAFYLVRLVELPAWLNDVLRLVTKFGPSLAGLIMAFVVGKTAGVRDLIGRLLHWRVGLQWYAIALLGPGALSILSLAVLFLFGSPVFETADARFPQTLGVFTNLLLVRFFAGGGLGEELGWRGFMLPRMQREHRPFQASLIVGFFAGFWHLPALGLPLTLILTIFTISGSVIVTWIYNRTQGSLLIPALLHAATNAYAAFVPNVFPALRGNVSYQLIYFLLALIAAIWVSRFLEKARPYTGSPM